MFPLPNPQTKRWSQPNNSDRFGTLHVTRNMDFDQEGYMKLSKRSRSIFDDSLDADLGEIIAITYDASNERYYILSGGKIFYTNSVLQTFTEDASANVPTTINARSDMVVFNDNLYVSAGVTDDLRRWTGSAWSTSLYSLSSNIAPMAVFENKVQLAIGQSNTVITLNTSHVLQQTLTLPADHTVTSLDYANNRLWIGTRNTRDGEAMLFEWDGNTSAANNGYPCGSVRIDCVKRYGNSVVIFTGEGQLLQYIGGGFQPLGNLPAYYTNDLYSAQGNSVTGATSHRGMVVIGDCIYINLRAQLKVSTDNALQPYFRNNFPGGIWCYDPMVGLYHKHSISADLRLQTNAVTTANVNTSTEVITVAGATVPATGTPVVYDDGSNGVGTAIGGLKHRKKYYTIYQSDTTLKLASTKALADAGTAIDLTSTGNNSQYFVFLPNRDFGGDYSVQGTAIAALIRQEPVRSDAMQLLFGATAYKTAVTTPTHTLNTLGDTQENRGSAVTVRLDATAISEDFINVTVKFKGIKTAEDKILLKYRIYERDDEMKYIDYAGTQTGTWSDSNTFTTTADLSLAKVGDEVTLHAGSGMGYTAHISAISYSAPTYTVDIDETIQNITAAQKCLFTVDNWEKIGTITTSDVEVFLNANGNQITTIGGAKTFPINRQGTWIQLKLELRGEDVAIEDILINNAPLRTFTT